MSDAHAHHGPNTRQYSLIGATLLVGTFAAYLFAEGLELSWMATIWLIFAIAACKVALVGLFFMHLKYEYRWKYVLCVPPLFLFLAYLFALVPDIAGWGKPPLDEMGWTLVP